MDKSRHPVDEFFSEVLKNYKVTPTEAARSAFLKEAEGIERTVPWYKSRKRWVFIILSGIILVTCIGIFISRKPDTGTPVPVHINKSASNNKRDYNSAGKNYAGIVFKQSMPNSHPGITKSTLIDESTGKKESSKIPNLVQSQVNNVSVSDTTSLVRENDFLPRNMIRRMDPVYPALIAGTNSLLFPVSEVKELNLKPVDAYPDSLNNKKEQSPIHKQGEFSDLQNHLFSGGIYYSPEWMFNILEANKNMRADNLGLEGTFHFGPYSVGTGIGLSVSKGTNEIVIGYNDYLGTYRGLDSIVFRWDAGHNHLVPVYYYTDKVVYDSLLKMDYSYFEKSYIYLQIPITLGYDFIRHNKFTIGVRFGPTLSILLQSKVKSVNYDLGQDRIVQMNNVTPERVETNWQISAGINAGIGLSRRFSMEVEPDIHYYFNSVYEKPDNNKKPWSAGFRVAILLNK